MFTRVLRGQAASTVLALKLLADCTEGADSATRPGSHFGRRMGGLFSDVTHFGPRFGLIQLNIYRREGINQLAGLLDWSKYNDGGVSDV